MVSAEKIHYEQPLNEHTRVCLRLEYLFQQLEYFFHDSSSYGSMACISTLIDLLTVLDRADLRNKLAKELGRYLTNLLRIEQAPNVDKERLNQIITQLEEILKLLHSNSGKFAQALRDNEFINSIRSHLGTPGGICHFDMPGYYLWLKKSFEHRRTFLKDWLSEFDEIRAIVNLYLTLTRESCLPTIKVANKGFYQASLDPQVPSQLIRVSVPLDHRLFPQISVGRYGISIRFYVANNEGQSAPTHNDIEFEFTCCAF